jgi:hypothetical protein
MCLLYNNVTMVSVKSILKHQTNYMLSNTQPNQLLRTNLIHDTFSINTVH